MHRKTPSAVRWSHRCFIGAIGAMLVISTPLVAEAAYADDSAPPPSVSETLPPEPTTPTSSVVPVPETPPIGPNKPAEPTPTNPDVPGAPTSPTSPVPSSPAAPTTTNPATPSVTAATETAAARVAALARTKAALPRGRALRVMLGGDSITAGYRYDYTWRRRLWEAFGRARVPVDFVGPNSFIGSPAYSRRELYLKPWADDQHAAYGGTTARWWAPQIEGFVSQFRPDILMVNLGHNDLRAGASASSLAGSMRAYITNALRAQPDLVIAVAEVVDSQVWYSGATVFTPANTAYNQMMADYAAQLRAQGRNVWQIDTMTNAFRPLVMTGDGTHLSPTGEVYMARRYASMLQTFGVLRAGASLVPGVPGRLSENYWPIRASALSRVTGCRVTFDWKRAADDMQLHRGVVRIYDARGRSIRSLRAPQRATTISTRLKPGRYYQRLRPWRPLFRGALGPRHLVVVRSC